MNCSLEDEDKKAVHENYPVIILITKLAPITAIAKIFPPPQMCLACKEKAIFEATRNDACVMKMKYQTRIL